MKSKIYKLIIRIAVALSFIADFYIRNEIDWYLFDIKENTVLIIGLLSTAFSWLILETIGKILEHTETIIDNQNYLNLKIKDYEKSNKTGIEKTISERFPNINFKNCNR